MHMHMHMCMYVCHCSARNNATSTAARRHAGASCRVLASVPQMMLRLPVVGKWAREERKRDAHSLSSKLREHR